MFVCLLAKECVHDCAPMGYKWSPVSYKISIGVSESYSTRRQVKQLYSYEKWSKIGAALLVEVRICPYTFGTHWNKQICLEKASEATGVCGEFPQKISHICDSVSVTSFVYKRCGAKFVFVTVFVKMSECTFTYIKMHAMTFEIRLEIRTIGPPRPNITLKQICTTNSKKYTRVFKSEQYGKTSWLCGCVDTNKLFCFPCLIFAGGEPAWCESGVDDLAHLSIKIKKHSCCVFSQQKERRMEFIYK
jgi:hypothetical protein